jgi:hypothetical protein
MLGSPSWVEMMSALHGNEIFMEDDDDSVCVPVQAEQIAA